MGPQSISPVHRPSPRIPHPPALPARAAAGQKRPARVGGHGVQKASTALVATAGCPGFAFARRLPAFSGVPRLC